MSGEMSEELGDLITLAQKSQLRYLEIYKAGGPACPRKVSAAYGLAEANLRTALTALVEERDSLAKEVDFLKIDIEATEKRSDALRVRVGELEGAVMKTGRQIPPRMGAQFWCGHCHMTSPITEIQKHDPDCIVRSIKPKETSC